MFPQDKNKINQHFPKISLNVFIGLFAVCLLFSASIAVVKADDYYHEGTVLSTNLLNGLEDVAIIQSFECTADVPASTTLSVNFSQDGTHWVNHYGYKGMWDDCSDGVTTIDLTDLEWTDANFYYKLKFETASTTLTPTVAGVEVNYADSYTPPASGQNGYHKQGTVMSTDLLEGIYFNFNGTEKFGYQIDSLPAGTTVQVQFSQDSINWYSSTSTLWAWDTLSSGDHSSAANAIDLSELDWIRNSFYYKLKFTTSDNEQTPVVSEIRLLRSSSELDDSENKTKINVTQRNVLTNGLMGHWTFDGPDIDWSQNKALDRSGQGNDGAITNMSTSTSVTGGTSGQALKFDGADDYIDVGNAGSGIKTISFWLKTDDITSQKIIDIDGTDQVEIDGSNDIQATSFPDATVYIDGTIASTITNGWHHILIVDNTGVNASGMNIGRVAAGYFNGIIDEVRIYNRALGADEIGELYRSGSRRYKIKQ